MIFKLFTVALIGLFAINGAVAQEKRNIRAGFGVVLGTNSGFDAGGPKLGFGLSPSIEYFFTDVISANVAFDLYFKSKYVVENVSSINSTSSFNIDARYYFQTGDVQLYGLVGLGVVKVKIESKIESKFDGHQMPNIIPYNSISVSCLNIGCVWGLGVNLQAKHQTSGQLAFGGGLVYTF